MIASNRMIVGRMNIHVMARSDKPRKPRRICVGVASAARRAICVTADESFTMEATGKERAGNIGGL